MSAATGPRAFKVGLTSAAAQASLGAREPAYGRVREVVAVEPAPSPGWTAGR